MQITLSESIEISMIGELHQSLARALADERAVVIDADKVEHIDTAGIQVLLGFVREIRSSGGSLKWQGVSKALRNAAELTGLGQELQLSGE